MQPEDKNLESNTLCKSKWLRPCPFCGKILLKFREIIKITQLNRAETVGKKFRQRPPLPDTVAGTLVPRRRRGRGGQGHNKCVLKTKTSDSS